MKINIPLDSVKKQIREEFRIAPLVTPEMREAEDLWMQIWMGTPPWENDQDRTINFAKAVTGEAARLATMGVSVELSGSARADWLQERLNEELIPFLRDMLDVGCAAGMFLLKPTPDSIGLYTPPEFTITAVDNRKRVIGVVLYDTKATPDYYYVKAEYHRYEGTHYVVSNRAFRLAKGKTSASRVNLDEVSDWVGILPDAVLDDTAPLFAVCTMPDANNIDGGACGMSIYANALPELRGLDVAWSAMVDEIQDSRSIALVDDRLLREPGRKNVSVRLPRYVQNVAGSAAESFYQEIDRKLKTGERQTGINMLLQSGIEVNVGYYIAVGKDNIFRLGMFYKFPNIVQCFQSALINTAANVAERWEQMQTAGFTSQVPFSARAQMIQQRTVVGLCDNTHF